MSADRFVSYAQNHEDVVLARALRPDDRGGFWVDVGAGDPVSHSVTAAFAERGWRGVNVEPLPQEYERLCEARPLDINLGVALGATPGFGKLFEGPAEHRSSSTMLPALAEHYRSEGREFTPIEVRVSTLAAVTAEHVPGPVDFLKVDVEGFEREVLAGADWSTFRPRVVVVEATEPNTAVPSHEGWEPILLEVGYTCAMFDGLNRFYARSEEPKLLEALAVPANVLDAFDSHSVLHESGEAERSIRNLEDALRRAEHAWGTARYAQERAAIADEDLAILRDDLAASQMRAAQALAELQALQGTMTFRYTASLRNAYGAARRAFKLVIE